MSETHPFLGVKIKVGDTRSLEDIVLELSDCGYERGEDVQQPGELTVRGNLLDFFPVDFRSPLRVEFGPDAIESIRDFTLTEGKTLQEYTQVTVLPVTGPFRQKLRFRKAAVSKSEPLESYHDIERGDYVVHLQHGIGKFLGLRTLTIQGRPVKHLAIEYADNEILYVDVTAAKLVERYIGLEGKHPKLSKLQSKEWERAKTRVRRAVNTVAREMLALQAKRSILKGIRFREDIDWQREFEKEFPYEETPDQARSTVEVKRDMESDRPMDRLLCGDVGYGKTEVAMRAAFKAVMSGKQVAMLVPTTILAEQHGLTFRERVKKYPVCIEVLSRFRTKAEQAEIVRHLRDGSCDIVIGTHRLLSSDIAFKDLGLIIVDEEQRFGVRHKEKLKKLRALVDILTLTATPIPRTLYLSLIGVRDMSVINTPPKARVSIVTELVEHNDERIREAIEREINRDGQIYFVHNRVESIEKIFSHLKQLLPKLRIEMAHGQMPPKLLEEIMLRFIQGKVDCLVATNIIESGLDIPNVNTIIVNRADLFGLADLYQLRGRVGRFNRQAYAYFVIPKDFVLTQDAEKRLNAIVRFTELGSGFKIALEDLEIRGAGNILGHEQSGFIYQVGFDLYCRMLRGAIEQEKKEVRSEKLN